MAKLQHRIQPASSLLSNARSSPIAVVVISYRTPPLLQRFCPHRGAFPWYAALVGRRGLAVVVCVCAPVDLPVSPVQVLLVPHRISTGFQQQRSRGDAPCTRYGFLFFQESSSAVSPYYRYLGTTPRVKPTMKLLNFESTTRSDSIHPPD